MEAAFVLFTLLVELLPESVAAALGGGGVLRTRIGDRFAASRAVMLPCRVAAGTRAEAIVFTPLPPGTIVRVAREPAPTGADVRLELADRTMEQALLGASLPGALANGYHLDVTRGVLAADFEPLERGRFRGRHRGQR